MPRGWGSIWALLCPGTVPETAASGGRLGIGPRVPAIEAARSWQAARNALRFASEAEPVIHWDELGCLGLLAALFGRGDLDHADLTALDRLAADRRGASTLATLDTFCATGSVRKTAALLYHHHSTIADHLARAQTALRFPIDTPAGRFRLYLALTLRKLRDNPHDR